MRKQFSIFDNFTDLRADGGPVNGIVQVLGKTVTGDSGRGFFYYDASSVSTDDDMNIIRPTGFLTGAWIRTTPPLSPIIYYDNTGVITPPTKKWLKAIVPSTSNGYSIDISSAGFGTIQNIQITAKENVATERGALVSIKSNTTTAVVVNIYRSKTTGVLIGGSIDGLEFHGSPGNVTLYLEVTGY